MKRTVLWLTLALAFLWSNPANCATVHILPMSPPLCQALGKRCDLRVTKGTVCFYAKGKAHLECVGVDRAGLVWRVASEYQKGKIVYIWMKLKGAEI